MIWDIIQGKIENAGLAVTGQSLFLDEMPSDVKVGVMMKSPLAGVKVDPHLPGYYTPALQIIVRHNNPVAGNELANQLMKLLTVEKPETHEATPERGRAQINLFFPLSLPIRYPRLTGDTIEWSLNFRTSFTMAPT